MNELAKSKLPKWVQREIEDRDRKIDQLFAELAAAIENPPTPVIHDPFAEDVTAGARLPRYLDPHRSVRFKLADHKYAYVDVRLKEDGTELELMASGPIVLIPQVTNVTRVRLA